MLSAAHGRPSFDGHVYLALDLKHDRRVATMVLGPELSAVTGALGPLRNQSGSSAAGASSRDYPHDPGFKTSVLVHRTRCVDWNRRSYHGSHWRVPSYPQRHARDTVGSH